MGQLIWSDWGRLVALTSGCWTAWGGLWGIFYRKYFWDFVDGQLGPAGIIPGPSAAPFVIVIESLPLIQTLCILTGLFTVAFEWPVFPDLFFYRNLPFKMIFYILSAVLAALVYQAADAAVLYGITIWIYGVALSKREIIGGKAPSTSSV